MPIVDYDDGSRVIDGVPVYYQADTRYCGQACVSSILAYWGFSVTFNEVIEQTNTTLGMNIEQMVWFFRKYGLQSRAYKGRLQDLKTQINKGCPVIVAFDEGSIQHVVVIVGYNDEKELIFYNESMEGQTMEEPYADFVKAWSRQRANSAGFGGDSLNNMLIQVSR